MSDSLAQKQPKTIRPELLYKHFDVIVTSRDPNGLPLNPKWGQHVRDNTNRKGTVLRKRPPRTLDHQALLQAWHRTPELPIAVGWRQQPPGCHHTNGT